MNLHSMPSHARVCFSCQHVCGNMSAAANGMVFCGQGENVVPRLFRRGVHACACELPCLRKRSFFSRRLFPAHAVTNPRERIATPSWFLVFILFLMPATVEMESPPSFSTVLGMSRLGRCE